MTRSRIAPWATPSATARLTELEAALADVRSVPAVVGTVTAALAAHRQQFDADGIVLEVAALMRRVLLDAEDPALVRPDALALRAGANARDR